MKKRIVLLSFIGTILYAQKNWIPIEPVNNNENQKSSILVNNRSLEQGIQEAKIIKQLLDGDNYNKDEEDEPKGFYNLEALAKEFNKQAANADIKVDDKHKIVNEYHKNGILKKSTSYLDEIKDGVEKEFYTNGKVMIKSYYVNGVKQGVETLYDENAEVFKKVFYKDGAIVEK